MTRSSTHTEQLIALEYPQTKIGEALNVVIVTVTILSIVIQVVSSLGKISAVFGEQIFTINLIIASILALDRFYRYICSADQLGFIFNFFSLVELGSFLPFFIQLLAMPYLGYALPLISTFGKMCMIIRLLRYFKVLNYLYKAIKLNRYKYEIAFVLLMTIWIISGLIMHYIEGGINHQFDSIPTSLRWSIVTMSTVGYGDLVPQTGMGKLIGGFVIFFGPVFLGIISSITVVTFLDMLKYHSKHQAMSRCPQCFNVQNDTDAHYCKICGTVLPHSHADTLSIHKTSLIT